MAEHSRFLYDIYARAAERVNTALLVNHDVTVAASSSSSVSSSFPSRADSDRRYQHNGKDTQYTAEDIYVGFLTMNENKRVERRIHQYSNKEDDSNPEDRHFRFHMVMRRVDV